MTISKAINFPIFEIFALIGLGELFKEQKQYDKALQYLERYSTVASNLSKTPGFGFGGGSVFKFFPLVAQGKIYLKLKQYDKAQVYLEQAYSLIQTITPSADDDSMSDGGTELLSDMTELYQGLGIPRLAIFYGKQEINSYQKIRSEIRRFNKKTQREYVKNKEPYYRRLSDILISEGRLPEAQVVLDLLKEKEFDQIQTLRSGDNPDTVPYSKAEAEVVAKIEKLAALGREQSELEKLLKGQGLPPADKLQRLEQIAVEIEVANKAFRESLNALAKSETSVEDRVAEIQTDKNLQRSLSQLSRELNTGAVAIYTLVATKDEENSNENPAKDKTRSRFGWVILVTPESRKAYPIDVSDLEETVFQFRAALSSDKYDPQPLAAKLYNKIFRQTSEKQKNTLEQDLETYLGKQQNKTIMWSLDGVLRYIPMTALHDGKNYLVEKYQHIVFTKQSLSLLNERDSARWQALGLGVSEATTVDALDGKKLSFSALAGAKRELTDIVREPQEKTGILEGTRRLDKDFTKDSALRLIREGSYPVIHIASHYSFNPTEQTASFLLVGDGKLTFADIQDKDNLFGSVDLLTLSACDTAMSGNGKEAEGFAYLAQSLGAKSVLASLWKVSDEGTPELMVRFYKLRAANPKMPKGESFRQAQLSLFSAATKPAKNNVVAARSEVVDAGGQKIQLPLFVKDEKKPFAHPHYWASFVLIGNWR